jgi:hypothetical protein
MITVALKDVQEDFEQAAALSQSQPVMVQREHEPVAVIVSMKDFEKFQRAQFDEFFRFCDEVGSEAERRGMTEEILQNILADE